MPTGNSGCPGADQPGFRSARETWFVLSQLQPTVYWFCNVRSLRSGSDSPNLGKWGSAARMIQNTGWRPAGTPAVNNCATQGRPYGNCALPSVAAAGKTGGRSEEPSGDLRREKNEPPEL